MLTFKAYFIPASLALSLVCATLADCAIGTTSPLQQSTKSGPLYLAGNCRATACTRRFRPGRSIWPTSNARRSLGSQSRFVLVTSEAAQYTNGQYFRGLIDTTEEAKKKFKSSAMSTVLPRRFQKRMTKRLKKQRPKV